MDMSISEIAEKTVGQFDNELYRMCRVGRITASNFGKVIRLNKRINELVRQASGLEQKEVYEAQQYGKDMESKAFEEFQKRNPKFKVFKSGIFICKGQEYLAASPDGLVCDDPADPDRWHAVLEIKCPWTLRNSPGPLAPDFHPYFLVLDQDGELCLKPDHDYYHQIMGQMFATGTKRGYFVVSSPRTGLFFQLLVDYDISWPDHAVTHLKEFYKRHMRPLAKSKGWPLYAQGISTLSRC